MCPRHFPHPRIQWVHSESARNELRAGGNPCWRCGRQAVKSRRRWANPAKIPGVRKWRGSCAGPCRHPVPCHPATCRGRESASGKKRPCPRCECPSLPGRRRERSGQWPFAEYRCRPGRNARHSGHSPRQTCPAEQRGSPDPVIVQLHDQIDDLQLAPMFVGNVQHPVHHGDAGSQIVRQRSKLLHGLLLERHGARGCARADQHSVPGHAEHAAAETPAVFHRHHLPG